MKNSNNEFLMEACRIGDWLLERTKTDNLGKYWETLSMGTDHKTSFVKSESIYSGVSGIVLFFLELYKQTQETPYLNAAQQGVEWVMNYCQEKPPGTFAFFTGRMGVSYTLLQMYRFSKESKYLENALALAKPCRNMLEHDHRIDDLINGSSGIILGLLHLHDASGEKWILETIDLFIEALLKQTFQSSVGLYWDRSPNNISGLCGFSHGVAGIGFVFLELGHYFQNESFYKVAEQAFLYERFRFNQNKEHKDWPDLRKGIYSDEDFQKHSEAFLSGNFDFFTTGNQMNAWCHGAAGIGLSRIRAYHLLKNPIYYEEALIALNKTYSTDVARQDTKASFILCHGSGGNAELFLYANQVFKDDKYLHQAKQIASRILAAQQKYHSYLSGYHSENQKEDTSLFMGNAGIGYFLLRLLNPSTVPSVQIPYLDTNTKVTFSRDDSLKLPSILISKESLLKRLLNKYFPRALVICEEILAPRLSAFFKTTNPSNSNSDFSLNSAFQKFIEDNLPQLPGKKKEILNDICELESEKWAIDKGIESDTLLSIKTQIRHQEAIKLIDQGQEALLDRKLILDPDCRLTYTLWNWYMSNKAGWKANLQVEPDDEVYPFLLAPSPLGISEFELTPFSYTVLGEFAEGNSVKQARQATMDSFESLSSEEEEILKGQILQQIEQGLLAGVLSEIPDSEEKS